MATNLGTQIQQSVQAGQKRLGFRRRERADQVPTAEACSVPCKTPDTTQTKRRSTPRLQAGGGSETGLGFRMPSVTSRRPRRLTTGLLMLLVTLVAHPVAGKSKGKLLLVSDIHFNPMADPTLVADLQQADPTQWEAIFRRSKLAAFSQYGQDTNWWLLQSALSHMQSTLPRPALVIYTGDLLAHEFRSTYVKVTGDSDWENYRAFVLKTVTFLALQLQKQFPGTKILLTPGNDDDDCGDYTVIPNATFLSDTSEVARELAKGNADLSRDWRSLGSYTVLHPTVPKLRIISLNTVFLSNIYQPRDFMTSCQAVQTNAASDLLNWLTTSLERARQQKERVWLIFHIPPGIDGYASTHPSMSAPQADSSTGTQSCRSQIVPMWVPDWTAQFDALLEEYRDTVKASFAGHTHMDDLRLISAHGADEAFVLITPAVSPIFKQNPAFRIVDFSSDGSVVGQSTYYLTNLKDATSTRPGEWKKEYQFSREWNVKRLDLQSLGRIYSEIQDNQTAREQWKKLYTVSSSAEPLSPNVVRGLYCAMGALDPASYASCYCGSGATNALPRMGIN